MDVNIDAKLAHLMNLRQKWIDEGFPKGLRSELIKELKSFSAELEIHKKLVESLEYEVVQGEVPPVTERGPQILPVRNQCTDIPVHVTCFKEYNGLIHGGIVYTPGYALYCRAWRFEYLFRWRCTWDRIERRGVVLRGECELRTQSGAVVDKWRVGRIYLDDYLDDMDPGYRMHKTNNFNSSSSGERSWCSFYFPKTWREDMVEVPDTGEPKYVHWGELRGGSYFWGKSPSGQEAVEDPFYNQRASCTPGFVICTPYIKVFHPDPRMESVVVFIVTVVREQMLYKSGILPDYYKREAKWHCKTFSYSI